MWGTNSLEELWQILQDGQKKKKKRKQFSCKSRWSVADTTDAFVMPTIDQGWSQTTVIVLLCRIWLNLYYLKESLVYNVFVKHVHPSKLLHSRVCVRNADTLTTFPPSYLWQMQIETKNEISEFFSQAKLNRLLLQQVILTLKRDKQVSVGSHCSRWNLSACSSFIYIYIYIKWTVVCYMVMSLFCVSALKEHLKGSAHLSQNPLRQVAFLLWHFLFLS